MTTFQRAKVTQGATTLPSAYYTQADIFATECERIFYDRWFLVGRAEQIPQPGDYFLAQVVAESLILVRDRDQGVRGFYNVCRHRGTQLCNESAGHFANHIACPYHAWTYGLDGQLLAARLMQEVEGFNKKDFPLIAVAVTEWEGFLWVNLSPDPEPFAQAMAPLIDKFTPWQLPQLRVARRVDYDLKANWKLIFQNYGECYHCPLIHPALDRITPSNSGRNDLMEGPFLGGYMILDEGSLTLSQAAAAPAIATLSAADQKRVYYYSQMPNVLLSLHPDYVMVHTLWPVAPDRTLITCEWLFDPSHPGNPDDAVGFWDLTNRQDWLVKIGRAHV